MKFSVFVALIGSTAAIRYYPGCNQAAPAPEPTPAPAPCQAEGNYCDAQGDLPLPAYSGSLDASGRLAQPGAGGADGYGSLSSENAASQQSIGASVLTIPDKNIVTDQAKVHESVAKGQRKA